MASELIHTCYRIGEIDRSVAFYEALGFEEVGRLPIREEAINVFMGLPGDGARLELTYNFGVDAYELGTGYNHIAVTVDDLDQVLPRLAEQGIEPEKPPYTVRDGGSRLCFVRDPDGYRIELIERGESLAVLPLDVVNAADGRPVLEGAVGPAVVVVLEPVWQCFGAGGA
jgi:lactoylglutathione lyase